MQKPKGYNLNDKIKTPGRINDSIEKSVMRTSEQSTSKKFDISLSNTANENKRLIQEASLSISPA